MPSITHEALVALFKNDLTLALRLLQHVFGVSVPDHVDVRVEDPTLNQPQPTQFRADLVEVLVVEDEPVSAVVVEVQTSYDHRKEFSWPVYATTLRSRLSCPVDLLVIAPDPKIAAWARQPIVVGVNCVFTPFVIGPESVPRVDDEADARRCPELAVLSVLAHGRSADAESLARAAFLAVADLDVDRASLYCDVILSSLGDAARAALEELMKTKYEYQSEFARKYYSQGQEEGIARGREEGRESALRSVVRRALHRLGVELDPETTLRLDRASCTCLEGVADDLLTAEGADILQSIRDRLRADRT